MSNETGGGDSYSPLTGASNTPYDISTTTKHDVLNYEGTPTQFSDDTGLRALLTRNGIMDVSSFDPIRKEGEKITGDTARQAHNEEGQLLFLDAQGNQTTRPTDTPMEGGKLSDVAYMKPPNHGGGVFGDIGYDLRTIAKDKQFHKFLLMAAAIASGGLAAGAMGAGAAGAAGAGEIGAGAAGALGGAEAFPVLGGGALGGAELGAAGTGTLGAIGEGGAAAIGGGGSVAGAGTLAGDAAAANAAMLEAGLTPEQITALGSEFGTGSAPAAGSGLTATEAMRYANLAKSALSNLGGGAGGAGAGGASGVLPTAAAGGAGASALSQMAQSKPEFLTTGSAPTTNTSGLIDYKPLAYIDPSHYSNVSDIKPLSMFDKSPFESGLHAAHGGHIRESMGRHPELQDIDPRLLSMIMQSMSFQDGGKSHVPEFITGATGHYVKGRGDGQSDDIPAMLADGEFVWDADTVAQLGNGSSDAGAKFLDKFREAVRSHKRSAPNDKIPPKASPLQYVKEAMKNTEKE